jgi:hypothetical protein
MAPSHPRDHFAADGDLVEDELNKTERWVKSRRLEILLEQ